MRVHLSLGSNVGDRVNNLGSALKALRATPGIAVAAVSHSYETSPVGHVRQPAFINMAVAIETKREPADLLDELKRIESELGRVPSLRWGPRAIDIDIILCEDRIIESERLTIPHREFRNRVFVLRPLEEIAGDAVDPVTGRAVSHLATLPEAQGTVKRLDKLDL